LHGNFPNAFVLNSSGILLAGTDGGIFRTADSGNHWVLADSGAWPARGFVYNAAGTLFAAAGIINNGGEGVIRSTDEGNTWSHARAGMTNNNGYALTIDRSGTLYCGTSSGVFRSTDNGDSWTGGITGLSPARPLAIAINEEGTIFAGGTDSDSGLYRSTDNGNSWIRITTFPGRGCNVLYVAGNSSVYAAKTDSTGRSAGAAVSTDGGQLWSTMGKSSSAIQEISSFCLASDGTLYAVNDVLPGVIRSTDNGASWTTLNKGLPNYGPSKLVITKNGTLLTSVFGYGVYRSTDRGDSWTLSKDGLAGYSTMAVSPNGTIFLAAKYASSDDGRTWTQTGFPQDQGGIFAINAEGVIYANDAADTTVFSTDNGQTWTKAGSGLGSSSAISAFAFSPNGQLFAATNYGRVFRSAKSTLTNSNAVRTMPSSEAAVPLLGRNYPNPFTTSTTLTFFVARTEFVSLRVYDLSGKEVGTMANGVFAKGSYQSSFPAGSLSNGIYLARLETEEGSWIQRLTLLR
jgi:photosystem II stability/assembly factor-like uncharacterized protein